MKVQVASEQKELDGAAKACAILVPEHGAGNSLGGWTSIRSSIFAFKGLRERKGESERDLERQRGPGR